MVNYLISEVVIAITHVQQKSEASGGIIQHGPRVVHNSMLESHLN